MLEENIYKMLEEVRKRISKRSEYLGDVRK
jgi:hypothetical protein